MSDFGKKDSAFFCYFSNKLVSKDDSIFLPWNTTIIDCMHYNMFSLTFGFS